MYRSTNVEVFIEGLRLERGIGRSNSVEHDVRLRPGGALYGSLKIPKGSHPGEIWVGLFAVDDSGNPKGGTIRDDDFKVSMEYRIEKREPGRYLVCAVAGGLSIAWSYTEILAGRETQGPLLELDDESAGIEGVLQLAGGFSVAGCTIQADWKATALIEDLEDKIFYSVYWNDGNFQRISQRARTDGPGRLSLSGLDFGSSSVRLVALESGVLIDSEAVQADCTAPNGHLVLGGNLRSVTVELTTDARPLPGVNLQFAGEDRGLAATTDEGGIAMILLDNQTDFSLRASPDGYESFELELPRGQAKDQLIRRDLAPAQSSFASLNLTLPDGPDSIDELRLVLVATGEGWQPSLRSTAKIHNGVFSLQ
ncbi:MAG: hypothetical protein ACI8X5_000917 [Planctomycetota bacterium]